jgi:sterol desaturase/sphingolipid hydroxylase (fatty acid hydroxylase superfamily)
MALSLQTLWDKVLTSWPYSDQLLFALGSWLVLHGTFWGLNLIFYIIYHFDLFKTYKVQPGKWPEPELVKRALKGLIVQALFTDPLAGYFLLYPGFIFFGMDMRAPVPDAWTILKQFALFIVINDTIFYWSHRLLHHPAIYKYVHKKHHEFKVTIGIAAMYAHPLEVILSNTLPTVGGALLVGAHPVVWFLWLWLRMVETVDAHSGYQLPFSPFHLLASVQGGAERHDFHHSHNVGNFGSFFIFWDWIMGTDEAYRRWVTKQFESQKAPLTREEKKKQTTKAPASGR